MLRDIQTVFYKELNEILYMRNSLRATLMSMFIPVIFIGVFFSLNSGSGWTTSPMSVSLWFMISFIMVSGIIADSFAGERERHTLETLLASRLPEPAILIGKIAAAVTYGFTLAATGAMVSLISVSLTAGEGHFLMFSPEILAAGMATGFLAALTAANAGILISLKASSARQAQQMLGFTMMFFFFSPVILTFIVPENVRKSLLAFFSGQDTVMLVAIIVTFVVIVDAILFSIAWFRFKRWKMILE